MTDTSKSRENKKVKDKEMSCEELEREYELLRLVV